MLVRQHPSFLIRSLYRHRNVMPLMAACPTGVLLPPIAQLGAMGNQALSNPKESAECTAEEAYNYTDGAAVFASGTAFPLTRVGGQDRIPAQANNSLVFPGAQPMQRASRQSCSILAAACI